MAAYRVVVLPTAARELAKLPRPVVRRVVAAIDVLAGQPRPPGARKLAGRGSEQWRIRVGDYRVLYEVRDAELVIVIVKAGHRREVYRGRWADQDEASSSTRLRAVPEEGLEPSRPAIRARPPCAVLMAESGC